MVETRGRKASFLREAARQLDLQDASVLEMRIEDIPSDANDSGHLITARALRLSTPIAATAFRLLRSEGLMMVFGSVSPDLDRDSGLEPSTVVALPAGNLYLFAKKRQ